MTLEHDETTTHSAGPAQMREESAARGDVSSYEASIPGSAANEPVLYVNDARYQHLWEVLNDVRSGGKRGEPTTEGEVPRLLFHEARMLDERRYDEWLAVFAPECLYWVPSRFVPGDPRKETAIYLDDRRRLGDRVAAIRTGFFHAQNPPSRTRRMLSNLEWWTAPGGGLYACANVVIWEHRKATTRPYPGWQAYEIVRDARGEWVVAIKIVCLLDCDGPQGNYAFIL
jgi:3-phenylpropionate/cinnamic acid dioxygenase small subunit